MPKDAYDLPEYEKLMDLYSRVHEDIQNGRIISAYALDRHGIAAAVSKMAFGNKLGVKIEHNLDKRDFFASGIRRSGLRGQRRQGRRAHMRVHGDR